MSGLWPEVKPVEIIMLLRHLSDAIKNQSRPPKAISCLSLVLYGERIGKARNAPSEVGGFECLKLCIYGIIERV